MSEEKRKKTKDKKGETYYQSHPMAEPIDRGAIVTTGFGYLVERTVWWIAGIIEIVLFFRIIIAAFGATGGNVLSSLVYAISYPLVSPFFTLFNNFENITVSSGRLEYETVVAIAIYYGIAYIVVQLTRILRTPES